MSYERLAKIMGQFKSTVHYWFNFYKHPHVLGFLSLLERLSPAQRQSFIEARCRAYPTFDHARLAHSPAKTGKLLQLLSQKAGLTIIAGGTDSERTFVFTALAHAAIGSGDKLINVAGIDLHRPVFVPVESLLYIDRAAGSAQIRQLTHEIWPKMLTSEAPRLFFNGVWSTEPTFRADLLRCAQIKHVFIAEQEMPDVRDLKARVLTPIHIVALATSKSVPGGILINCRRINRPKQQAK
jgi:hypothetical protein